MVDVMTADGAPEAERGQAARPPEFRDFFEAEYERLGRALFLVTGSPSEAEDLAQEAFVRVYERWDRIRTMDSPTGYLFRTAMNLHRSRLRRMAAWARRRVDEPLDARARDPGDVVGTREEIAAALAALPSGQRTALVLVEWVGMSDEEAGAALGIAAVSVRVRISRARAFLRSRLGGDDG